MFSPDGEVPNIEMRAFHGVQVGLQLALPPTHAQAAPPAQGPGV